jgi:hypothetical protein
VNGEYPDSLYEPAGVAGGQSTGERPLSYMALLKLVADQAAEIERLHVTIRMAYGGRE